MRWSSCVFDSDASPRNHLDSCVVVAALCSRQVSEPSDEEVLLQVRDTFIIMGNNTHAVVLVLAFGDCGEDPRLPHREQEGTRRVATEQGGGGIVVG